jgi:hypothetical protein
MCAKEHSGPPNYWCQNHLEYKAPVPPKKTLGTGEQSIYVYYYKNEAKGKILWPCKIGRTRRTADGRIKVQVKTAHCGIPVMPLLIQTDDAERLEGVLHAALTYAGRHIMEAWGKEWFHTNPREVEALYDTVRHIKKSLSRQKPVQTAL